ncbi:MAG: aminoglycoside phosphotransferase family protein [Clostridia bacterium]|nr:aminoglycoside phosphotransferase family protein [Clostridia bacterium]
MLYNDIKGILPHFPFEGRFVSVSEMSSGNINNTYHLVYRKNGKDVHYTLQHINRYVFHEPEKVMENIMGVTEYLKKAMEKEGINPDRRVLAPIRTRDGETMHIDRNGDYWRSYHFIDGATPYDAVKKPEHFYEVGRIFGVFQKHLCDYPVSQLNETIPDFHNTTRRFYAFVAAVAADKAGRVEELEDEIEFFFERRKTMGAIVRMLKSGALAQRVTHNDTKINNVLIDDETDKAICVIDLDTVMPGSSLYDFGDAIRYGASTAAEDEENVDKIALDMNLFRMFTEGFLSEVRGFLPDDEIRLLPLGVQVITCELAMRFLTDYIDGDLYFKVRSPYHNLIRAHAQMKLLTDIESKLDEMNSIIEELLK